jgi:hypothetical protein
MTNSELMYFPSATITMEKPISTTIHINDIKNEDISKAILHANDYTTFNVMKSYGKLQDQNHPEIVKIEVLVPNKVLRFTFKYGTQIKTVCNDEDTFDFDFAIYLAYSKLVNSNNFTKEGIEYKAHEMKYWKLWNNKVKKAKKLFKQQETERIKQEKEEKERAAARKRQAEKKARKKKERKERELKALAEKIKNVE